MQIPGVDWAGSGQTLVLAVSDSCHFCSESADFYRRLAQEKAWPGSVRLIAVLPQEVDRGREYLDKLGVSVDQVEQAQLSSIGVRGTPTLLLIDSTGSLKTSWVGKLTPDKEGEVLNRVVRRRQPAVGPPTKG
ncbi:MAG: peroxiredoxin family protein [Pyrinomonadaceae bacterium]